MKKEFGENYDKKGKYKKLFEDEYTKGEHAGDITEVSASVRATYTEDAAIAKRKKEAGDYWTHTGPDRYISINDNKHWHYKYKKENIDGVEGYYFTSKTKEDHTWDNKTKKCKLCGHKKPAPQSSSGGGWNGGSSSSSSSGSGYKVYWKDGHAYTAKSPEEAAKRANGDVYTSKDAQKKGNKAANKAAGGYVGHGIYELGELGTETVLTAEQTQVLRNNILSNRPNSLISLLKSYNESYSNINKPLAETTTAEDNSINIGTVELSMNIQQLANDYDARRAGEQALSEIMRIAKKTSAANSIRR